MEDLGNHEAITLHPRSSEYFWQQYQEDCGFTYKQFTSLWEVAEAQYGNLPYHNFHHAADVLWAAMELGKKYETSDNPVDFKVLIGAALFHDAGYHKQFPPEHSCKEVYSAEIFESIAFYGKYGFTEEEIAEVEDAIISTHQDVQATSRVSKLLNRADLSTVGGSYAVYDRVTNVLKQEARQLNDDFDKISFAIGSINIVAKYLIKDLSLSSDDHDWYDQAVCNLNKRIRTEADLLNLDTREFVIGIGSLAVNQIFDQGTIT